MYSVYLKLAFTNSSISIYLGVGVFVPASWERVIWCIAILNFNYQWYFLWFYKTCWLDRLSSIYISILFYIRFFIRVVHPSYFWQPLIAPFLYRLPTLISRKQYVHFILVDHVYHKILPYYNSIDTNVFSVSGYLRQKDQYSHAWVIFYGQGYFHLIPQTILSYTFVFLYHTLLAISYFLCRPLFSGMHCSWQNFRQNRNATLSSSICENLSVQWF